MSIDVAALRRRIQSGEQETLSVEEFTALTADEARRGNKYGAVAVETADGRFDSQAELRRWQELQLRLRAGEITSLQRQRRYRLTVRGQHICDYSSDFEYDDLLTGQHVTEDLKSSATMTPVYRLKKRLMLAIHGIEIHEVFR